MIVLDLDGTLLNSNKKISDYTCEIIKKIKNNNKVVLASARGFLRIKPYLETLDLISDNNYTIAFNGSLVLNNDESIIIDNYIDLNCLHNLNKFIEKYKDVDWFYYTYNDRINYNDINNLELFMKNNKIYKIVCCFSVDIIKKIRNNINVDLKDQFEISSSEGNRIEFVKKGINKVKSIQLLLDKLNISKENLIAIGDGENDLEMIKFAGIGIAMENAPDIVKKSADIVTSSNDCGGVGKILNRLFIDKVENKK